jgi:twitching motility protein PilT
MMLPVEPSTPDSALPRDAIRRAVAEVQALAARDDESSIAALTGALDSEFWSVRRRAAELLAARGRGAVQRIQAQFAGLSDNQRHWALTIVAWVLAAEALPWLKTAYSARNGAVRASVISAVSEIPGAEAAEFLVRALEDDSWLNRCAAAEALEKRGNEVIDRLKQGFTEGSGDIKFWSLKLLLRVFGQGSSGFLAHCRVHDDPDIRHYAIRALGETEDDWVIPELVECLADRHWTNRQLASRLLTARGKRSIAALAAALGHANPDIVFWSLQTLARIGDEAMLKPVVMLVINAEGDRAVDVREWAVEALANVRTEASARRLVEIACEFPDLKAKVLELLPAFRMLAVRPLLRDAVSPNTAVREFTRRALADLSLPGVPGLVAELTRLRQIELDAFYKALRGLSPLQVEMIFTLPSITAQQVASTVSSSDRWEASGITRIPAGIRPGAASLAAPDASAAPAGATAVGGAPEPRPRPATDADDSRPLLRALGEPSTVASMVMAPSYAYTVDEILVRAIDSGASDIHIKPGLPPIYRIRGVLAQTDLPVLSPKDTQWLISRTLPDAHLKTLITRKELDASYEIPDVSRFRVNCFSEMNGMGMVLRVIPNRVPSLADLELPRVFRSFCNYIHGMILICGPTGSGKSTTLAAMIDYINETREEHVLTIEDPIEFRHTNKKCLITSRELGTNTLSFGNALRSALREDPDIILVGELRDFETIELAMTAAETGHLVLSTLHTGTSAEAVDRLINSFPAEQQQNARVLLASVLRAVVCQMLLPTTDAKRTAVLEVLINNYAVANLIREKKMAQVDQVIVAGRKDGMQGRDDHLFDLYRLGRISTATALEYALSRAEMEAKMKRAAESAKK